MFSHFALISVELANSFWPRKLSAAPIGVFLKRETLFEALVSNSGLEILRRTRSFPERTNSAGSVAAILWQLEISVYRERQQDVVLARPGQLPVRAREQRVGPRAAPQVQHDGTSAPCEPGRRRPWPP